MILLYFKWQNSLQVVVLQAICMLATCPAGHKGDTCGSDRKALAAAWGF